MFFLSFIRPIASIGGRTRSIFGSVECNLQTLIVSTLARIEILERTRIVDFENEINRQSNDICVFRLKFCSIEELRCMYDKLVLILEWFSLILGFYTL